jgi:hypothetical protein
MQAKLENAIYGVDPGEKDTGWVIWNGKRVLEMGITPNEEFLERLRASTESIPLYIEMIASYGMPVGKSTFETVVWIGRFIEVWSIQGYPWQFCYRTNIRTHHCNSSKAGDANVAQALRDKYGDKGTKKQPGPFFGVRSHIWSAVAIATYAMETKLPCSSVVG